MKVKRQKRVRKLISFYSTNYGLRAPYKVLVDGTFCKAALKFKVNISEQLSKYVEGEVQLSTTNCVLAECESLGKLTGALQIWKRDVLLASVVTPRNVVNGWDEVQVGCSVSIIFFWGGRG